LFRPAEFTLGAFGEKLRKQREQRGISLDAISTTTKISPRMLRAIEDEHFDQLPGGVFNKGFVRAYARQVGLDEEETISDYLTALRESQIQSQTILPNFRNSNDNPAAERAEAEPTRLNPNVDLAGKDAHNHGNGNMGLRSDRLESSAAGDSATDRRILTDDRRKEARRNKDREVRSNHGHPHEARPEADGPDGSLKGDAPSTPLSFLNLSSAPSSSQLSPHSHSGPIAVEHPSRRVPWERLAAALLLITVTLALWTLRHRSQAAAASQPAASSHASPVPTVPALNSKAPSTATPSLTAKHSPPSAAPANLPTAIPPDADVNPPVAKPHPRETAAKPPLTFTLLIRADQTSWVLITADGQIVAQETLIAPANTSVRASREIIVRVGNAAGISFLLNGKEIPTQGNPGEVRTFTFDATGMRASAAVPSPNTTR
jgi:hypothetical protein